MTSPILQQYQRICGDPAYRQALIDDPRAVLSEEYGCEVPDGVKIQVIEQRDDTITLVVPIRPADDDGRSPITRVVDLLFDNGIGGFLVPDDQLKWVLRDMRTAWGKKVGGLS